MCHIWADEMRTVVKDEGVLIFFVLVPLFYPLLYSWIYTNEVVREVPVAVVDMSHSAMSREFIRQFDASPDVRVVKYCTDLDEAKDAVGRQEAFGVVYFPIDFQTRVLRMEQSRVSVFCDMSFMLYYKAIFQTATAVAGNLNSDILIERSGNWTEREDEITAKPLDFDEVQIFNATGGYGNFIIPGVLMLIIQQTLLLGVGLSVGTARERSKTGSFLPDDPYYDGVFRTVLGRALAYFMVYAVVAAYVTLVVPRMFGFTSLLHPGDTFWFMLPYVLSCVFFAVSWPQSAIPPFWQWISWLVPSTFGIRGFVRMNTMGALLGNVRVEYVALWAQAIVYFFITCLLYRWQVIKKVER